MRYLPNFRLVTNNSLSTVRRAIIALAPAVLFPTTLYGASSLPTTLPTSVPVNVTNTPLPVMAPSPLPVSGSVTVNNAVLPITGNVGLVGTPTVNVASPITTTAADNPAKNAFQAELSAGACHAVPATKRAVIEFASARGLGLTNAPGAMPLIGTTVGGVGASHSLPLFKMGTQIDRDFVAGTAPMRAYADPGSSICINIANNNFLLITVVISGHYVDI